MLLWHYQDSPSASFRSRENIEASRGAVSKFQALSAVSDSGSRALTRRLPYSHTVVFYRESAEFVPVVGLEDALDRLAIH